MEFADLHFFRGIVTALKDKISFVTYSNFWP